MVQDDKWVYYRDGGRWETDFRIDKNGKIFAVIPFVKHIHNIELIKCTKAEWKKDNDGYAPSGV